MTALTTLSSLRTSPAIDEDVARAALAATAGDPLLHAGTALMLLAGLRPSEVRHALVKDWTGGDDPRLTIQGKGTTRTIRVAPTAAKAVTTYLAGGHAKPAGAFLLGLGAGGRIARLLLRATQQTGLVVSVDDLRRSAVAAALEDGTPPAHLEAYFGLAKPESRKDSAPVREGYDCGIAALLEQTFAA